jgi:hypothetical protein
MSALSKVKKGGTARWVIRGVQQNDTFTIPRGFRIRYLAAEPTVTAPGGTNKIGIGVAAGTFPVQTWTAAGTVGGSTTTVTVDGIAVTVVQGDTASIVVDKIMAAYAAGSFTNAATTSLESWTLSRNGLVITATGNCPKSTVGITTTYGSITGFTVTSAQVVAGSVDETAVNATTIANYAIDYPGQEAAGYTPLTLQSGFDINSPSHSPYTKITFSSYTGTMAGGMTVNGVAYNPTGTTNVTNQATAVKTLINASSNQTGLSAVSAAGVVTIYNNKPFYGSSSVYPPVVNVANLTGATVATASSALDKTYYLNLSGYGSKSLEGNVNLYVLLEKLD